MKLDNVKSGFNLETINENFQKLEDVINDEVMFRKPPVGQVNHLEADVDMNGKRIYNSAYPEHPLDLVRLVDLKSIAGGGGGTADGVVVNTNKGLPGPTAQDALDATWDKLNVAYYEAARAYSIASGHRIAIAELTARVDALGQGGSGGAAGDTDNITYKPDGRILTNVLNDLHINVKDYGALGDGVTDDTDAIQEAYEAAYAQKKNMFFPAGEYMTTGLLFTHTYQTSFKIEGCGWGITTIRSFPGSSTPTVTLTNPSNPNVIGPNEMIFRGIRFRGNYPDVYSPTDPNITEAAFHMSSGFVMTFEDCWFSHAQTGFYNYTGVLDRFERCHFTNSDFGIRILGEYSTTTVMHHCDIKNNYKVGLHLDDARQTLFVAGSIEGNGQANDPQCAGVFVGNKTGHAGPAAMRGRGLTLRDSWIELNRGRASLWFSGGVNTMHGCIVSYHDATVEDLVYITGGGYRFTDNIFEGARTVHVREENAGTVWPGNTSLDNTIGAGGEPINIISNPNKTITSYGIDSSKVRWDGATSYIQMRQPTHFQSTVRMDGDVTDAGVDIAPVKLIPININGTAYKLGLYA